MYIYTSTPIHHTASRPSSSAPGPDEGRPSPGETSTLCLSLQELSSSPHQKQRLHISPTLSLSPHQCEVFGGYVCARRVPGRWGS